MEKGSIKGLLISTGLIFVAVTGALVAAHYIKHDMLGATVPVKAAIPAPAPAPAPAATA